MSEQKAAPIPGAEMTKWKLVSPYKIYFRHALNSAIPATLVYSVMAGYSDARVQFPKPKHIPAQVAWNNAVCTMKKAAAPIIGTMAVFNLARGHWEQNHFTKSQFDIKPVAYGLAFASIPFIASVLLKKPNVYLGGSLFFCLGDYAYDRFNSKPVDSQTWAR